MEYISDRVAESNEPRNQVPTFITPPGKNTVFLLSRKIYSEYFKKLNVSDTSESYLLVIWFTNFYSDFFLKSEFLPSQPDQPPYDLT